MNESAELELRTPIGLAKRCGIGRRTINRLLAGRNTTIDTLQAVADELAVHPSRFFVGYEMQGSARSSAREEKSDARLPHLPGRYEGTIGTERLEKIQRRVRQK